MDSIVCGDEVQNALDAQSLVLRHIEILDVGVLDSLLAFGDQLVATSFLLDKLLEIKQILLLAKKTSMIEEQKRPKSQSDR